MGLEIGLRDDFDRGVLRALSRNPKSAYRRAAAGLGLYPRRRQPDCRGSDRRGWASDRARRGIRLTARGLIAYSMARRRGHGRQRGGLGPCC